MRRILVLLPQTAAAVAALLAAPYANSKGMGGGGEESQANAQTRRTPAMRERVYTRLAEAQECAEMDDIECAQERLAHPRSRFGRGRRSASGRRPGSCSHGLY